MYGMECRRKRTKGACRDKGCLFPQLCPSLPVDHGKQIELLRCLRKLPGIRKVFIGSGIRYDLIISDQKAGSRYLEEIVRHHVSGQLKIAPEHSEDRVLEQMGKPGRKPLEAFIALFEKIRRKTGANVFLTYYLMAAHPGCTLEDMHRLKTYAQRKLHLLPEQIQIFTPSPSTFSTVMYHTGKDPFTDADVFVERSPKKRERQKAALRSLKREQS
jgi:uncharacterized radical SAM protein YgiQ